MADWDDGNQIDETMQGRTVQTDTSQATAALVSMMLVLTGGDRQLLYWLTHLITCSIGWSVMRGNGSEGATAYARDARDETAKVWDRIEFSVAPLTPAQMVFLAGRLCLEASRRMGVTLPPSGDDRKEE